MKTRTERLLLIRRIIEFARVSSQDELLKLLESEGEHVSQSTLSRDLKELKVAKIPDPETGYVYKVPADESGGRPFSGRLSAQISGNILSLSFSANIAVMHTGPGCANAVAALIDAGGHPGLLGTVAGNDTVLLVLAEEADRRRFILSLRSVQPDIHKLCR